MTAGSMRVAITTLGCKVNRYDTAVIEQRIAAMGWQRVDFDDVADAYVVNSCTVTDRADRDSRALCRRARRNNPAARVIMTGCYAQVSPEAVSKLDSVDYVVGLGRVDDLLKAVAGELASRSAVSDLRRADTVATLGIASFPGRSRAFVKVQEGCDLFCTFCVVPVARGRSRSVPARDVLDEIERLAARGFREVVLTGVHLGGYGADLDPPCDLAWLLECIAERRPAVRVRVSSIDPPELTPRLLDVLSDRTQFCPHVHVPLQSLDDGVLTRMRRRYSAADAVSAIDRARARLGDDLAIGTDLLTGFPEESEAEFDETWRRADDLALSYLHVFPYSQRTSTSAAKRWHALPDALVHGRATRMRELDAELRARFRRRFVGREVDVLFEGARDPATGRWTGYSEHYVPVACASDAADLRGSIRRVRVESEAPAAIGGDAGAAMHGRIL
ncbi:MAG TPA: tRNA (N(6)-L-threonylcarbamoyladenosine(37)-C(2))-methylthiotransferase MtaB [Candidatus Limnocylindrales bacterium]|nr:tRNA (N(6)-L-threonylcarbamoyladenosine(37)-C(2))-methylthiotransferase MtaB [Candidatus Limnocylindrales bacterium]